MREELERYDGVKICMFGLFMLLLAIIFVSVVNHGIPITIANKPEVRFVHEHVFLPGEVAEVQPNGTVKLRHPDDGEVEP